MCPGYYAASGKASVGNKPFFSHMGIFRSCDVALCMHTTLYSLQCSDEKQGEF